MTTEEAMNQWAVSRADRLALRSDMQALRCEYEERAEPEVGDSGVPRCYLADIENKADWCEMCRKRDDVFQRYRIASRAEESAFRRFWRRVAP